MTTKNLMIALLLAVCFAACLSHPTTSTEESTTNKSDDNLAFHKNTKIAILGGGPAGLFAARQLKRAGYRKVTVFEASATGTRTVHTEVIDDHVVDFTTRYLPNANPEGQGLYPALQSLIDEYGLTTDFVSTPITYVDVSSSVPVQLPIPHIFADLILNPGPIGIIGDLIWGFEVLRVVYAAPGVSGCHTALGVAPGTSFQAWASAVNKPAFTRLAAFTNDAFLGGPATTQDVCAMLKVRTHFMPGDIAGVLRSFGLTNTSPIPMSDALKSLLVPTFNPNRKLFNQGYKNFFDTMVDVEGLNVELGAKVVSVERKNSEHIKIDFENGDSQTFDKVIIATKPSQALQFLKDDLAIKPLLAGVETTPIHIHAFHTTESATSYPSTGAKEFSAILYPFAGLLGTSTMPEYAFAVNKEHADSSLVIAIGYANNDGSTADEAARAQQASVALGYTPTDSVLAAVFPYPAVVPATVAATGWHAQTAALQGEEDYYFIGEAFSGYGVPSVLEDTTRVIAEHFLE